MATKIVGFCHDGVQLRGGRYLFWWEAFQSKWDFRDARRNHGAL